MREIKVYLRRERVDAVVHALREAGIGHMTVTPVHTLGSLTDPAHVRISFETGTRYTEHAKLEFVCSELDVTCWSRSSRRPRGPASQETGSSSSPP